MIFFSFDLLFWNQILTYGQKWRDIKIQKMNIKKRKKIKHRLASGLIIHNVGPIYYRPLRSARVVTN